MAVSADQRFTKENPCPICGGHDRAARGRGIRCWGYTTKSKRTANCTSADKAGPIKQNAGSETYPHKLQGNCPCGFDHSSAGLPATVPPTSAGSPDRNPQSEIDALYDYTDEVGRLLSQAVRWKPKGFSQRKPHPDQPGKWIWKVGDVRQVPYRLPELINADPEAMIFVTEGEKDVNRLYSIGLNATTNIAGAGKWRDEYSQFFAGRDVCIIPDLDPVDDRYPAESLVGQRHAMKVAASIFRTARTVRVLELPDLPERGDVSDFLDAGGTKEQLLELAAATEPYGPDNPYYPAGYDNGHDPDVSPEQIAEMWTLDRESKHRETSNRFRNRLNQNGEFIYADGQLFYFDRISKTLCDINGFDMECLLNESYKVNSTEAFFKFLIADLKNECQQRGRRAKVHIFAHYEEKPNVMYVDLCLGRMLRLNGQVVEEVDNGTDGILFTSAFDTESWEYIPDVPVGGIRETMIEDLNFAAAGHDQKFALLIWMLAVAFESVQPTKPLALAIGPAASGKSFMFRRVGRLFYGSAFNVTGISRDGEKDFFVQVTNTPFAAFDNVDSYIPWLEDALASSSTGMKIVKRVLYETNRAVSYEPKCFIALTARTPRFRRDDVAERILPFNLDRLDFKRPESELLTEILFKRDDLLSEYVNLLNLVVAQDNPPEWDSGLRLADFAKFSLRVGAALQQPAAVQTILTNLKSSQAAFATEEDPVFLLLDQWTLVINEVGGLMDEPNDGRRVRTQDLFTELRELAIESGESFYQTSSVALGRKLSALEEHLKLHFVVESGHTRTGTWWQFNRTQKGQIFDDE